MSVATDLNSAEQADLNVTDTTTGTSLPDTHISALAVPTVKLDQINNWTGVNELPFDPIAERLLEMEAHDEQGDHKGELSVTFGRPLEIPGKGWACVFRLSAMGRVHTSPARGLDAVDALQQAFTTVHRQLQGMGRMHRITFAGSDDLGFAAADANAAPKGAGCPVMSGTMSL